MKVKEIMTRDAKFCELNASLADAAKTMWDNDCGVLPVLKDGKEMVGLITDRDICMAVGMRDGNPSGISIKEVITDTVYSVVRHNLWPVPCGERTVDQIKLARHL